MMIVEPKMTQLLEPDEEPIDLFNLIGRIMQKPSLFLTAFATKASPLLNDYEKVKPQPIEVRLRGGQGSTVTRQALNANG